MKFEHVVIDPETPGVRNDVCLIADVNGNGYNDIVIGGHAWDNNVVWYEYPSWKRHIISTASLEAGGVMADINKNGRLDVVAGNQQGPELYWFENPEDPTKEWKRRIICNDLFNYHDQAFGDVDNDGEMELVVPSQGLKKKNGFLYYYKIPKDPTVEPWPVENRQLINQGLVLEGLSIADVDGDGQNELMAGPNMFKKTGETWERTVVPGEFQYPRVATGDLTGDGKLNVVITEGESNPGRLAWFGPYPEFKMNLLADDLFHPHTLELADFNGDGLLDIFVGEMDLKKNPKPRLIVFLNKGDGTFEKNVIWEGVGTHDAKVGDIGNTGRPSIVGKPYIPGRQVDLWINQGE